MPVTQNFIGYFRTEKVDGETVCYAALIGDKGRIPEVDQGLFYRPAGECLCNLWYGLPRLFGGVLGK